MVSLAAIRQAVEPLLRAPRDRVRQTSLVSVAGMACAAKRFQHPGWLATATRSLPALREWNALRWCAERALPAPEPLALGEGLTGNSDVVLTGQLRAARNLQQVWQGGHLTGPERLTTSQALGGLIRRFHRAGLEHRDLHPGNVMLRAGLPPDLWLIDFHRSRVHRRMSHAAAVRDVLLLTGFFHARASLREKLAFLRAYDRDAVPRDRRERRRWYARWWRLEQRSVLRLLRHHERRAGGGGRDFERCRSRGSRGVALRGIGADARSLLGSEPLRALAQGGLRIHHSSRSEVLRIGCAPEMAVKVYQETGFTNRCKRLLRGSRARRAWRNAFRLHQADIAQPAMLFYLESPPLARRAFSLIATEFLPDSAHLGAFAASGDPVDLEVVLDTLAVQVARLHRHFLRHRDLKAENLLVRDRQVFWLDPDGVRRRGLRRILVGADLMRLNASFPELSRVPLRLRLQFVRRYQRSLTRHFPGLAREVCARTRKKWRRAAAGAEFHGIPGASGGGSGK